MIGKDLVGAAMLVVVGEAANRKLKVLSGNYTNMGNLWLCIIGRSGTNKTMPLSRVLKPLEFVNRDMMLQYQKAFAEWKNSGAKGVPPMKTKILVGDSTPESRSELLQNNGLLLYRDELYGFFRDFGRYHSSGEIQDLLTIWSNKSLPVDRKTMGSFHIEEPFMSIVGGIQPEVLREAFGRELQVNGFLARWLFVWVDSKVSGRLSENLISKDIENLWFSLIYNIWRMPKTEFELDDYALSRYNQYGEQTAFVCNQDSCEDSLRLMLSKLRINALRIALAIHLLKYGHHAPKHIDGQTMDAAIATCNAFQRWNERALAIIQDSGEQKRISNAALIRELVERFNIKNQSALARVLGRSQQYLNKVLSQE